MCLVPLLNCLFLLFWVLWMWCHALGVSVSKPLAITELMLVDRGPNRQTQAKAYCAHTNNWNLQCFVSTDLGPGPSRSWNSLYPAMLSFTSSRSMWE